MTNRPSHTQISPRPPLSGSRSSSHPGIDSPFVIRRPDLGAGGNFDPFSVNLFDDIRLEAHERAGSAASSSGY
jgi:hypothetical protein